MARRRGAWRHSAHPLPAFEDGREPTRTRRTAKSGPSGTIRAIAPFRKSTLFGRRHLAALLIETRYLNAVDPRAYTWPVPSPARQPPLADQIDQLMPWAYADTAVSRPRGSGCPTLGRPPKQ